MHLRENAPEHWPSGKRLDQLGDLRLDRRQVVLKVVQSVTLTSVDRDACREQRLLSERVAALDQRLSLEKPSFGDRQHRADAVGLRDLRALPELVGETRGELELALGLDDRAQGD